MKSSYIFCSYAKIMLSPQDRVKYTGLALVALLGSVGLYDAFFNFYWFLWTQPQGAVLLLQPILKKPVLFGSLDYAVFTGLSLGYVIRNILLAFHGYREERVPLSQLSDESDQRQLPERCQIRITEIAIDEPVQDIRTSHTTSDIIECDVLEVRDDIPVYSAKPAHPFFVKTILRILLTFFDRINIVVQRSDGLRKKIWLNSRQFALAAYIATRNTASKTFTKEILKKLYYGLTSDSLYADKSKIQHQMHEASAELAPDLNSVSFFRKRDNAPGYTDLALSKDCIVDIPYSLKEERNFVERMSKSPSDVPHPSLKALRQQTEEYIRAYGRGFLAETLELDQDLSPRDRRWAWALPLFEHYRAIHFAFLTYAARREHIAYHQAVDTSQKRASWKHLQELHHASALAGTVVKPEEQSERELQRFFLFCLRLHDTREATEVCHLYISQMNQIHPSWEPAPKTKRFLEALCTTAKQEPGHFKMV